MKFQPDNALSFIDAATVGAVHDTIEAATWAIDSVSLSVTWSAVIVAVRTATLETTQIAQSESLLAVPPP